ncbi:adenylate/guanylate cyclase domain-containing protein [Roseibium aggregatum]|uniref:Adenylate/guanylate cyclase domain-containing protein n=1 Tax=Roseibium aggregatum TaxID=187304 RepID=A0A926P2K5_9HYPH|nr:adenylate/guanylate cyclase domain-containing protein [Roseibium aggregatum]MBD1545891.1 adenylate/guanylate cyclase domain-containing protein [Roseibium aggregatum]
MRAKRRLAAVMCADVAHYARLMEVDEDGTLDRLKSYREIMSQLAERHNGRIVNTWGDAVIIEFSSVVEAVQCAVEIQTELSLRNADLPDARKMEFRIGLNLGDLMVEGDDIYGDGVNVAARLQELAPRGGILLSQSVYDQVRSKMALGFEPLGLQQVKNVSEPVETYAVRLGGRNAPEEDGTRADQEERHSESGSTHNGDGAGHRAGDRDVAAFANGFEQARAWLMRQPRVVRRCVFMIGFFFLLNLLTTGLSPLWFVWPSLPFFVAVMWHLFSGKGDRKFRGGSHQPD